MHMTLLGILFGPSARASKEYIDISRSRKKESRIIFGPTTRYRTVADPGREGRPEPGALSRAPKATRAALLQ